MPHLRVAERGPDRPPPRRIRRWPVVRSGSRSCVKTRRRPAKAAWTGRASASGIWVATHASKRSTSANRRPSASARARIGLIDIQRRLQTGGAQQRDPGLTEDLLARDLQRLRRTRRHRAQRPAQEIPGIFDAARAYQRRGVQRRAQLATEAPHAVSPTRRCDQEPLIEIVRDQTLAERHQHALRERRLARAETS